MMNDTEPLSEDTIEREIANLAPEDLARIRKAAQLWRARMLCLWKLCRRRRAGAPAPVRATRISVSSVSSCL